MTSDRVDATPDERLISKKDVLERTDISYGQFYRWKRKGLIPESWFTRKSTYTGQETFLPRDLVLDRIEAIKSLKDEHSLEEIAELLSPEPSKRTFTSDELRSQGWIGQRTLDHYRKLTGEMGPFRFRDLVLMELMTALERDPVVDPASVDRAVSTVWHARIDLGDNERDWQLSLVETEHGEALGCLAPGPKVAFDPTATVLVKLELEPILERVRRKLSQRREDR